MAQPNVTPQLEDFWKTLWHVDVAKDHKNSYDQNIVNDFLPNDGEYKTTQQTSDGKYISVQRQKAGRNGGGGNILSYEELFDYLTNQKLSVIFKLKEGADTPVITLNDKLVGPDVNYTVRVFNFQDGANIKKFINEPLCLYADTSSHLPKMMVNYNSTPEKPIYYAYTREIQSDAAEKPTYESFKKVKGEKLFCYELPADDNERIVEFPKFNDINPMSYFYCKYPVFLTNDGVDDKTKYNLKVQLSYTNKDNRNILVSDGANIAGAFEKFKNCFKNFGRAAEDNISKELNFISKCHGDVAQAMTQFRTIKMESPYNKQRIDSLDFQSVFVSIDVNAISKALTFGTPYIFMYTPDKERLIVWKKLSMLTEEEKKDLEQKKLISERATSVSLLTTMKARVEDYNKNIKDKVGKLLQNFTTLASELLTTRLPVKEKREDLLSNYKQVLRQGIQIAILSSFLPKDSEIKEIEIPNITEIQNGIKNTSDIKVLKRIQQQIKAIDSKVSTQTNFLNNLSDYLFVKARNGNPIALAPVSLENDGIIEFVKSTTTNVFNLKYITFKDDSLKTINLRYDKGDTGPIDSLLCRNGSKLNIMWGFDIIYFAWSRLKSFNKEAANVFIEKLREIAVLVPKEKEEKPAKIETFNFGLGMLGIGELRGSLAEAVAVVGGTQTQVMMLESKPMMLESKPKMPKSLPKKKVIQLRVPTEKEIYFADIVVALDDMINHLKFVLKLIYLSKYQNKITYTSFQRLGYVALNTFINKTFGENYKVPNRYLTVLTERFSKKSGGSVDVLFKQFIREAIKTAKESKAPTGVPQNLPQVPTFGEEVNKLPTFFNSTFSFLPSYEKTVDVLSKIIKEEQGSIVSELLFPPLIRRGGARSPSKKKKGSMKGRVVGVQNPKNQLRSYTRLVSLRPIIKPVHKYGVTKKLSLNPLQKARWDNLDLAKIKLAELESLLNEIYKLDEQEWFPNEHLEPDNMAMNWEGGRRYFRTTRKSKNPKRKTIKRRKSSKKP